MPFTQRKTRTGIKELRDLGMTMPQIGDKALESTTGSAVVGAVEDAPVKTGNMQSQIDNQKVTDEHWQFRSMASYSGYVEYGTDKALAQPFMEPNALKAAERLASIFNIGAQKLVS